MGRIFQRITTIKIMLPGLGYTVFGPVVGVPVRPTGTKTLVQEIANFQHRHVER